MWIEWKRWKWTLDENEKGESEHLKRMKKVKVNTWREWKKSRLTFHSLREAPQEGSAIGGRKARKSPEKDFWDFSFPRKLNIVLQSSPLRKIFETFVFQEIEYWLASSHLPVPAGLQEDRQGCRAQGGCSSCCRWSGRRDLVMMMLMMTMMVMVMAMMMFMMMTMMMTIRLSWRP